MALCEQNMAILGRCSAQNGLYLVYLNTRWCSRGPTLQMLRGKNCTTNTSVNNEKVLGLPSAHFDGSLWQAQWEEWWWGPLPQSRALLSFGCFPSFPIGVPPLLVINWDKPEKWGWTLNNDYHRKDISCAFGFRVNFPWTGKMVKMWHFFHYIWSFAVTKWFDRLNFSQLFWRDFARRILKMFLKKI